MKRYRPLSTAIWQGAICLVVLSIWQWGYDLHAKLPWLVPDLLDPYFISRPSDILENFLMLSCIKSKLGVFNGWFNGDFAKCLTRSQNNLWIATAVTLKNTFFRHRSLERFRCWIDSWSFEPPERDFSTLYYSGKFDTENCARADHRACVRYRRYVEDRHVLDRRRVSGFF